MGRFHWTSAFCVEGARGCNRSLEYNPGETLFVTASKDQSARIWNAATGREIAILKGHTGSVEDAVFSPDGQFVATASFDNTARLWNAQTGEQVTILRGHQGAVYRSRFSPDGKWLVTASHDRSARLWDFNSGNETARLEHNSPVFDAAFSPNGSRVATAANFETAIWDGSGRKLYELSDGNLDKFSKGSQKVSWSPDSTRVVTFGITRGIVRVWDSDTGRKVSEYKGHSDFVNSAAFSPESSMVLSTASDASLWNSTTGGELARLQGHDGNVLNSVFDSKGETIVTVSDDKTARLWDLAYLHTAVDLKRNEPSIKYTRIPDGHNLISMATGQILRVWQTDSSNRGASINCAVDASEHNPPDWLPTVALDKKGKQILTALAFTTTARIWDTATGATIANLQGHSASVRAAAFSPDAANIATGSEDESVRLWDVASGKLLATMNGHTGVVAAVDFSNDGKKIASGGVDKTLRLWDAATGRPDKNILAHSGWINSVKFSPDSKRVLTASSDHTARLWDATSGNLLMTFKGHALEVDIARFSHDGTHLLTISVDRTIRLWEARTGNQIASLPIAEDKYWDAAFDDDDMQVVLTQGGELRRWNISLAIRYRSSELRDHVCRDRLIGAQSFTVADADNPILSGLEGSNPCDRRGIFSAPYWRRLLRAD
jgi:WD40 repeat protein